MSTRFGWPAALLLSFLVSGCAASGPDRPAAGSLDLEVVPETSVLEGAAHGFPALLTSEGKKLGDGDFTQWIEGDRLHARIHYDLGPGRWIEERSVLQQQPRLVQEQWSWVEMRDEQVLRRFEVDFLSGNATAEKLEKNGVRRWSKHLDMEPGRTFAGFAWALAIKSVRERLLRGEKIRFRTVGFTPKPTAATVEISHRALDQLSMSGRTISGDRFLVHPKIPWIARPFVTAPDSKIWLTNPAPAAFLRFEGPLAEPDDAFVRVDLLP